MTKRVRIFRFPQNVENKKFNKKSWVCWCYGVRLSASQCAGGVRWQAESSAATLRSLLCEDWSWCWYCWGLGGARLTLILLCEEKYWEEDRVLQVRSVRAHHHTLLSHPPYCWPRPALVTSRQLAGKAVRLWGPDGELEGAASHDTPSSTAHLAWRALDLILPTLDTPQLAVMSTFSRITATAIERENLFVFPTRLGWKQRVMLYSLLQFSSVQFSLSSV